MDRETVLTTLQERAVRLLKAGSAPLRPDAAAWVIIAFGRMPALRELLEPFNVQLRQAQLADGRVPIAPAFSEAAWPTPLALLAWLQIDNAASAARAIDFLLKWQGLRLTREPEVLGHDTMLTGWPWVSNTHSWIEPTALSLLALSAAGKHDEARCAEARKLIMNRQLPSGGWNFGNTTVFGRELRPMVHSTGMALTAMASNVSEGEVAASLSYLKKMVPAVRAPLSLGWSLIALTAWNEAPDQKAQWISECLEHEKDVTEYDPFLICLLYCALLSRDENPLLRGMKVEVKA